MVLDEVGPGVFGITRNNESNHGKAAITSYNSYDSLTVFSQRDYANSFGSYVRAKRDSLVTDMPVWSGPQNNLHGKPKYTYIYVMIFFLTIYLYINAITRAYIDLGGCTNVCEYCKDSIILV
ncbi:hypothetical protein Hanom_Chr14g01275191 [Helianthus anomalus]